MRSAERSPRRFTSLLRSSRAGPTRLPCASHSLFRPSVDIAALRALIGCLHRGFTCAPSCGLDFRSSGVWRWSAKQVIGQLPLLKLHDSTRAKTNTLCEYLRHVHILTLSQPHVCSNHNGHAVTLCALAMGARRTFVRQANY